MARYCIFHVYVVIHFCDSMSEGFYCFYWGSCYSIFSFICMFCQSLFVLFLLAIGHCVVCSSSIYGFGLPLWYLQTLLIRIFVCLYLYCHWSSSYQLLKVNVSFIVDPPLHRSTVNLHYKIWLSSKSKRKSC